MMEISLVINMTSITSFDDRNQNDDCCFESKLVRIFQEQERAQVGLKFGERKIPQCCGLTREEFQHIDVSKINLLEIHVNILKNINIPSADKIFQGLKEKLTAMTRSRHTAPQQGGL